MNRAEKMYSTVDRKGNKRRDNNFDLKDLEIDEA